MCVQITRLRKWKLSQRLTKIWHRNNYNCMLTLKQHFQVFYAGKKIENVLVLHIR